MNIQNRKTFFYGVLELTCWTLSWLYEGWSGEVRNITFSSDGKTVSVVYRVTIRGLDGEVCTFHWTCALIALQLFQACWIYIRSHDKGIGLFEATATSFVSFVLRGLHILFNCKLSCTSIKFVHWRASITITLLMRRLGGNHPEQLLWTTCILEILCKRQRGWHFAEPVRGLAWDCTCITKMKLLECSLLPFVLGIILRSLFRERYDLRLKVWKKGRLPALVKGMCTHVVYADHDTCVIEGHHE